MPPLSEKPSVKASLREYAKIFATYVTSAQTIVIKAGSSLLTQQGKGVQKSYLTKLARFIHTLREHRKRVILVTSGAVAAGKEVLPPSKQPSRIKLATKQALASMGQVALMESYRRIFSKLDIPIAQLLMSTHSINHRASYLNARHTLQALWELSALPIINENDPLATEEIKFGDNDVLGALICGLADADLYIILSDTAGFYYDHTDEHRALVKIVDHLTTQHWQAAKGPDSHLGTGGMITKLKAVAVNEKFSLPTLLTHGNVPDLYTSIFKDHAGTLFLGAPQKDMRDKGATKQYIRLSSRKRWLFSNISPKGELCIDTGAREALLRNKSLLAKGIISVKGSFHAGDTCSIICSSDVTIPNKPLILGRGLCNYASTEVHKICGIRSDMIPSILGYKGHDEVIHKNNLVLL